MTIGQIEMITTASVLTNRIEPVRIFNQLFLALAIRH